MTKLQMNIKENLGDIQPLKCISEKLVLHNLQHGSSTMNHEPWVEEFCAISSFANSCIIANGTVYHLCPPPMGRKRKEKKTV